MNVETVVDVVVLSAFLTYLVGGLMDVRCFTDPDPRTRWGVPHAWLRGFLSRSQLRWLTVTLSATAIIVYTLMIVLSA